MRNLSYTEVCTQISCIILKVSCVKTFKTFTHRNLQKIYQIDTSNICNIRKKELYQEGVSVLLNLSLDITRNSSQVTKQKQPPLVFCILVVLKILIKFRENHQRQNLLLEQYQASGLQLQVCWLQEFCYFFQNSFLAEYLQLSLSCGFFSEEVVWRCCAKKVFLEILQNSRENTCTRASSLIKLQA